MENPIIIVTSKTLNDALRINLNLQDKEKGYRTRNPNTEKDSEDSILSEELSQRDNEGLPVG